MKFHQPAVRSRRRIKPALAYVAVLGVVYLLSLGPASVLKTSGAVDRVAGGCQLLDAYARPGVTLLIVPGFGVVYERYLRWWDDIDEPG